MFEKIESSQDPEGDFEIKTRKFFSRISLGLKKALRTHKDLGGLWGPQSTPEDWRNVTRHCLIETARAEEIADILGLSPSVKKNLRLAAALHDFNKKKEIKTIKEANISGGPVLPLDIEHEKASLAELRDAGFSEDVLDILEGAGGSPPTLLKVREVLQQTDLTPNDWAFLIMHYIDAYTRNDEWVGPDVADENGQVVVNEVDRRAIQNRVNPNYRRVHKEFGEDLEGRGISVGGDYIEFMAELSHQIEGRLSEVAQKSGRGPIEPINWPFFIDQQIKEKITREEIGGGVSGEE